MGQYDIALRHIMVRYAKDLVQGLWPDMPVESVRWVETQLTAMERRMDKALEFRCNGALRLLHVEVAAEPDDLEFRVFAYANMLVIARHTATKTRGRKSARPPVKSVALLLSGRAKAWPDEGTYPTNWPEEPKTWTGHRFDIEPVYQKTVSELLARPGAFWLVFAPLAVDATPELMKTVIEELRRREPQDAERAELHGAMLVVAELNMWGHNLREEIKTMLDAAEFDMMMQSATFREAFDKGVAQGVKKGVQKGVKKGEKTGVTKGRKAAIEEMLQRLLRGRMQRELTTAEQAVLSARAAGLSSDQAGDVCELDADALRTWLSGCDAE